MLRNIKLYGSLAIDTGVDSLMLDVNTPAMMLRGLNAVVADFRKASSQFKDLLIVATREQGPKK